MKGVCEKTIHILSLFSEIKCKSSKSKLLIIFSYSPIIKLQKSFINPPSHLDYFYDGW